MAASFHTLFYSINAHMSQSATPKDRSLSVWPLPLSLATTYGISFDFSSWSYLDVSVHSVYLHMAIDSPYSA